jgi:hypothetical protein
MTVLDTKCYLLYVSPLMKEKSYFLAFLFLSACLTVKADAPIFGNSTNGAGTAIVVGSGDEYNPQGGAIGFTPATNIAVTSVTIWLTGYNGQNGQGYTMALFNAEYSTTPPTNQPAGYDAIASFNTPPPNDGTTAAFTFTNASGATVLQANQTYWLFIGGYGTSTAVLANWEDGGTPTGIAAYYGAEAETNDSYVSISATPAFTINSTNVYVLAQPPSSSISLYPGITISGTIGAAYEVQYTTNLASGNWMNLTNIVLPSSPFLYFDPTPVSSQNQRFYQVISGGL